MVSNINHYPMDSRKMVYIAVYKRLENKMEEKNRKWAKKNHLKKEIENIYCGRAPFWGTAEKRKQQIKTEWKKVICQEVRMVWRLI